jgi:hypothetical protein
VFPLRLLSCTLGLVLTTSAFTVSSASSVLALLSIGLVVNLSSYLISLSLILSYLISLPYLIVPLFIVWTMVAPATPSHSVLVLSFVPNTSKHGPCAVAHGVDRSLFFGFFTHFLTYPSSLVIQSIDSSQTTPAYFSQYFCDFLSVYRSPGSW